MTISKIMKDRDVFLHLLKEITRIPDLVTPMGKFNVYNTANDVY